MSEALIIRMREAAFMRCAGTAMIGAEDLSAAADALESLEAAYTSAVEAGKSLAQQAFKAEQERDALAAELKAARVRVIELEEETKSSEEMQTLKFCEREWSTERAAMMNTIHALRNCGGADPVPARELTDAVDDLAQHIRQIDGNHSMGAGELAESIAEWADRHLKGEAK